MSPTVIHRRHTIRTQRRVDGWRAQAIHGQRMVGPAFNGATEAEAAHAVCEYLDGRAEAEQAKRGPDGYPSLAAVEAALAVLKPTDQQRAMLEAHVAAPDGLLTATELARAAGYASYETANSQYGGLGRALAEEMDWTPELRERDGRPIWTFALATEGERADSGEWRWLLRPEVAEAARRVFANLDV